MPTASPIIVATVWAMSGTAIRCPIRPIRPSAVVRPITAPPIGMPIATTVPNVSVRISIAARMPIRSLVDVSLGESVEPIEPPPLDLHPGLRPGFGGVHHPLRLFLGELVRADAEQHRDERGLAVLRDLAACPSWLNGLVALWTKPIFLIALYESVIACLLAESVTLPLVTLKMIGFEPFCCGGKPACEQVGGRLAAGAGQVDVVARSPHPTCLTTSVTPAAAATQISEHDHRMGGDQPSQAVQQPCHECDDISGRAYDAESGHRSGDPAHPALPRRRAARASSRPGCSRGAGGASELSQARPSCSSGTPALDDAAVWRISDDLAVVHTIDFFTPLVDDPYTFGRIAATNAISDIYAMGARPAFALNVVAFPKTLPMELLGEILRGGADVARAAGVAVAGGHSIDDPEPKYGMAVTGFVHPDEVWTNARRTGGRRARPLEARSGPGSWPRR